MKWDRRSFHYSILPKLPLAFIVGGPLVGLLGDDGSLIAALGWLLTGVGIGAFLMAVWWGEWTQDGPE